MKTGNVRERHLRRVGLRVERHRRVVLAQNAGDVVASSGYLDVATRLDCQAETGVINRPARRSDQVTHPRYVVVPPNLCLLVPVGIYVDTALLAQDSPVVALRPECLSSEVTLHGVAPSRCEDEAGLESGWEVLLESDAQVRDPLRLLYATERANLGLAFTARFQLARRVDR
jgi:hypothetical protein